MFKLIIWENGKKKELENTFKTEVEAEHYAEGVGFEAYKVIPITS